MLEGIIRARYRESSTEPKPITPDEAHKDRLDLGPTAYVCEDGHRLRLHVSSSDFPQSDRNLTTGGPLDLEGSTQTGLVTQTVLHDVDHPSRLILSVVEA